MRQFQNFKDNNIDDIQKNKATTIINLFLPDLCYLITSVLMYSPLLLSLSGYCLGRDTYRLIKINRKLNHFRLTDFCLEHTLEIKKLTDIPDELKLSKEAKEALIEDQGFTLNHSDRYRVSDLKQLRKIINGE